MPRPLAGRRLNDTAALVAKGICPPQGIVSVMDGTSPEAAVTVMKPSTEFIRNPAPDPGNTFSRACDYMGCKPR